MNGRKDISVVIRALKKTVAFQDDLVKKLAGTALIVRAIEKAQLLGVSNSDIHVLTDSEEIELMATRKGIQAFCDRAMEQNVFGIAAGLEYLQANVLSSEAVLDLSPYAPLLPVKVISDACDYLLQSHKDALQPVTRIGRIAGKSGGEITPRSLFEASKRDHFEVISGAFFVLRSSALKLRLDEEIDVVQWMSDDDLFEIESYQKWWVAEKLLRRKRIVFRVIGNESIGMGHIYRALALAHEITDHELLFVCESEDREVVDKLAGYDYWFEAYSGETILHNIIDLKPDLVINDILSTTKADVALLKRNGIRVVNFEDLGSGAGYADLTINELYETPQTQGNRVLWGHNYFFVRDEFQEAKPAQFQSNVKGILLTFGGTDQKDLSRLIYHRIRGFCQQQSIEIYIVTGPGYRRYERLAEETKGEKNVYLTHNTGVMSGIMEKVQVAITSNGRTVYELAHMNIPAVVLSHHEREQTHSFACEKNGFSQVGIYKKGYTENIVALELKKLVLDEEYRSEMFKRIKPHKFDQNKSRVLESIYNILNT